MNFERVDMAKIHLMHGYIAAGKTTLAKKLEHELNAVRFTTDEWMVKLYGCTPAPEKYQEYESRIKEIIWELTAELIRKDINVILDFGFWRADERKQAIKRAKELNTSALFYVLEPDLNQLQIRNKQRNVTQSDNQLIINDEAFSSLQEYFEPITKDENLIIAQVD